MTLDRTGNLASNTGGLESKEAQKPRFSLKDAIRQARAFRRDEGGTLIVFALFIFVLMLMVGGMAVDFMRFESTRTKLQNTVDRAVLAAASLNQPLDPQSVVEDYFAKAGMSDFLVSVNVQESLNSRIVTANTNAVIPTLFLKMSGINSLSAPAAGTAEESESNVEISLVLDISGSMGRNNKIVNLRSAAKEFVNTMLKPESVDKVSISLIPYTAQVNAGPAIFNQLNVVGPASTASRTYPLQPYTHCIDFDPVDFNSTALDFSKAYRQMQHFEWSSRSHHPINNPGCPKRTFERIVPFSQSISSLENTINQYRARANTAIHIGMKWGSALLDPATRPIIANLTGTGVVDSTFANRPAEWDDPDALKVVVLMTDGENVNTYRIRNWAYNSPSEYAFWNRNALWYYLYRHVSSSRRYRYYYRKYSAAQADNMLSNICDAAKNNGITVFTIGFEVGNHGADVMRDCASTPSHFFRVEGVEISDAFRAIAHQINRLRLTQ